MDHVRLEAGNQLADRFPRPKGYPKVGAKGVPNGSQPKDQEAGLVLLPELLSVWGGRDNPDPVPLLRQVLRQGVRGDRYT